MLPREAPHEFNDRRRTDVRAFPRSQYVEGVANGNTDLLRICPPEELIMHHRVGHLEVCRLGDEAADGGAQQCVRMLDVRAHPHDTELGERMGQSEPHVVFAKVRMQALVEEHVEIQAGHEDRTAHERWIAVCERSLRNFRGCDAGGPNEAQTAVLLEGMLLGNNVDGNGPQVLAIEFVEVGGDSVTHGFLQHLPGQDRSTQLASIVTAGSFRSRWWSSLLRA